MKKYPKVSQDLHKIDSWDKYSDNIDSVDGSLDDLILRFRNFYKEAHLSMFNTVVRQIWLEQQITDHGIRRRKRMGNGHWSDTAIGKLMKIAVGNNQGVLTANFCFTPISTYLNEFFPDFLLDDPFKTPEKYKFPYNNVSVDHMFFVYQMDNRLELLQEVEDKKMLYAEFTNFVVNWAVGYNLEKGREKYTVTVGRFGSTYIRNNDLKKLWENDKLMFNLI